eukprot:2230928-Alexandrium_andersonii.AAC.1
MCIRDSAWALGLLGLAPGAGRPELQLRTRPGAPVVWTDSYALSAGKFLQVGAALGWAEKQLEPIGAARR